MEIRIESRDNIETGWLLMKAFENAAVNEGSEHFLDYDNTTLFLADWDAFSTSIKDSPFVKEVKYRYQPQGQASETEPEWNDPDTEKIVIGIDVKFKNGSCIVISFDRLHVFYNLMNYKVQDSENTYILGGGKSPVRRMTLYVACKFVNLSFINPRVGCMSLWEKLKTKSGNRTFIKDVYMQAWVSGEGSFREKCDYNVMCDEMNTVYLSEWFERCSLFVNKTNFLGDGVFIRERKHEVCQSCDEMGRGCMPVGKTLHVCGDCPYYSEFLVEELNKGEGNEDKDDREDVGCEPVAFAESL